MNRESVDAYLRDGCGRCEHYQTPRCKVHPWAPGLVMLRELLRQTELQEEMKWGSPCYTLGGKNVAMMVALRDSFALSFFKGAALPDEDGALVSAGPNSHVARLLRFTSVEDAAGRREQAARYIHRAIEAERAGVKVAAPAEREPMPEELARRLEADDDVRRAFEALTPGRQRSHILHVGGAKQSATRERRVEQCVPKILAGHGFLDR